MQLFRDLHVLSRITRAMLSCSLKATPQNKVVDQQKPKLHTRFWDLGLRLSGFAGQATGYWDPLKPKPWR